MGRRVGAAGHRLNRAGAGADSPLMRLRLRLVALALVAQLASGCFVFDEIDKGNKELDAHSPTRNKAAKEKEAKATAAAAAAQPGAKGKDGKPLDPKERSRLWWQSAHSLSTAEKEPTDNPHVRCKISGKERFMLQSDCASQGGKVL